MSTPKLGHVVHARRKRLGRTLAEVSHLSGLSVPFLSQIENGRANASLRSLQVLADALDTTATALLGAAEEASRVDVVRAGQNALGDTEEEGTVRVLVRGGRHLRAMEFTGATEHGDREFRHDNDELFYVVAGSVRVRAGDAVYTLGAGDTLYCAAGVSHCWRAETAESRLLLIAVRDDTEQQQP